MWTAQQFSRILFKFLDKVIKANFYIMDHITFILYHTQKQTGDMIFFIFFAQFSLKMVVHHAKFYYAYLGGPLYDSASG